jgi:hypothetical protein
MAARLPAQSRRYALSRISFAQQEPHCNLLAAVRFDQDSRSIVGGYIWLVCRPIFYKDTVPRWEVRLVDSLRYV